MTLEELETEKGGKSHLTTSTSGSTACTALALRSQVCLPFEDEILTMFPYTKANGEQGTKAITEHGTVIDYEGVFWE